MTMFDLERIFTMDEFEPWISAFQPQIATRLTCTDKDANLLYLNHL